MSAKSRTNLLRRLPAILAIGGSVALALPAIGCGVTTQNRAEQSFDEQIRAFHMHMRWGRYRDAAAFVETDDRSEFIGYSLQRGDDYHLTEYEIENVDYDGDTISATLLVWVQSYELPSTTVDETIFEEEWAYNEERRSWEMVERSVLDDHE